MVDDDQRFSDFVTALNQEFATAMRSVISLEMLSVQGGYDIWTQCFTARPSPKLLKRLSSADIELLRLECERSFEVTGVTALHIRGWMERTLWRWPAPNDSEAGRSDDGLDTILGRAIPDSQDLKGPKRS